MAGHLESFKQRHSDLLAQSELDKRLIELSALFEISKTLNASLDLPAILDNILLVPMGRMMISRGAVLLRTSSDNYKIEHVKGLPQALAGLSFQPGPVAESAVQLDDDKVSTPWEQFLKDNKLRLILPLISGTDIRGLVLFGRKLNGKLFSSDEIQFLLSLCNIAGQAVENARMLRELNQSNRRLGQKVQELNTLFEIGREFGQMFDRKAILKQLSYSLMGQLLVNQFFVALKSEQKFNLVVRKGSLFKEQLIGDGLDLLAKIAGLAAPKAILEQDDPYQIYDLGIRAIVPMVHKNDLFGYIFLGPKMDNSAFSASDFSFLSTLANMVVISIENARLVQETIEKKRMEEELNLAKTIQKRLLPSSMPKIPGFDIHGLNLPSKQVGGDYFDIIQTNESEYILTIADVSGKGMPAALLMSNLQAGLHSLAGENYSLAQVTSRLNRLIHRNTSSDKYITFFMMRLNSKDGTFEYVNAGHNPPYHVNCEGNCSTLDVGGIILGMMADAPYSSGRGRLQPGECLMLFTDGVTETMNESDEEFTEARVMDFLKANVAAHTCESLNKKLLATLTDFAQGDPTQGDDVTILTVIAAPR